MTRQWMSGLAVASVLACLAGCNSKPETVDSSSGAPRQTDVQPDLTAQAQPVIRDVPIPEGFTWERDKARSYQAGNLRNVEHVYKGRADQTAVWRFYKQQMPINQWAVVTETFKEGVGTLDFDKGTERCRITIYKGDFLDLIYPTRIRVEVTAAARIESPTPPPAAVPPPTARK